MSRRLRTQSSRLQQMKEDEEELENKYEMQMKRIYDPVVWYTTVTGFRIQDIKEKYFNEVIEIFKEHCVRDEVLYKNAELYKDEVSLKSYSERLLFYLRDSHSILAVNTNYQESTELDPEEAETVKKKDPKDVEKIKIAGALILKMVNKNDFARVFSRVQLVEGEAMKKCIAFRSHINQKVDIFAKFDCNSILRYYDLCILPEYRHKVLGFQMLRCGLEVARSLNVSVVMGLFSSASLQKLAKKVGMEIQHEINYVNWRDPEGELIFSDPGAGNYTLALMAGVVPSIPLQDPQKPKAVPPEIKPQKTTRAEKRVLLAKSGK